MDLEQINKFCQYLVGHLLVLKIDFFQGPEPPIINVLYVSSGVHG